MATYNTIFGLPELQPPTPGEIIFGNYKPRPRVTPGSIIFSNDPKPQPVKAVKAPAPVAAPAPIQQQVAKAIPKVETPGTGANRGAVGSLGRSSGAGVAGNAQAGLLGSVNTEVQNDDMLLPYQKV